MSIFQMNDHNYGRESSAFNAADMRTAMAAAKVPNPGHAPYLPPRGVKRKKPVFPENIPLHSRGALDVEHVAYTMASVKRSTSSTYCSGQLNHVNFMPTAISARICLLVVSPKA